MCFPIAVGITFRQFFGGASCELAGSGLLTRYKDNYPSNNRLQSLAKTNGTQKQYSYDANGNMLQAGDNVVKWTSYNQPLEIRNSKTNSTATFLYDANQQRVQQVNGTSGKSETTTYVSKAFEVTHNDNGVNDRVTQYKHQIYAGDEVVAIQIRTLKNGTEKAPDETRYLHKDALGNVDTLTDSHGTVIQRISYDPFGKRTVTSGTDPDLKAWTARGFTGHEHLDNLGLIHMNARLYDPEVGRFISPDTYIQAPDKSQNYNRYVYVMNNPLKYTDPSGHFFWFIVGAIVTVAVSQSNNAFIRTIGMVAGMAMMGGVGMFGGAGALSGSAVINGMAAGFVQGYSTTGNLGGALRGMVFAGLSAGAANIIGHGGALGGSLFQSSWGTALAHGISQGVISQLRGGSFKSGFVGAIVGGMAGNASRAVMSGLGAANNVLTRTVVAAVFGGLASRASGGSFEDGAMAAAFRHLFNEEMKVYTFKGMGSHAAMEIASGKIRKLYDPNGSFRQNGVRFPVMDVSDGEYVSFWHRTNQETVYVQSIEITSEEYDQLYESLDLNPTDIGFFDCALSTSGRIWSNVDRFEDLGPQFFPSGIREYFEDKGYPAVPHAATTTP